MYLLGENGSGSLGHSVSCAPKSISKSQKILLTGATGFVGGYLLKELIDKTDAEIVCLVRSSFVGRSANARLQQKRSEQGIDPSIFDKRVRILNGNLERAHFGLSKDDYLKLAAEIDTVFHLGAKLSYLSSFSSLEMANVVAVRRILEFCRDGCLKALHHMSTSGVYMSLDAVEHGYLTRDVPLREYHRHPIGYFRSKWTAELEVQAARQAGLPVMIYRPSFVGGTLNQGYLPESDLTRQYLAACLEVGAMPDVNFQVDLVPVDILAKAVAQAASRDQHERLDLNLCNPHPQSLASLAQSVPAFDRAIEQVSYREWSNKLHRGMPTIAKNLMRWATRPCPNAPDGLLDLFSRVRSASSDCIDTTYALSGCADACPPVDAVMLDAYLQGLSAFKRVKDA
jgi:myxalamid-type nonribosomal peptide synthetase MxaA